MKRKRFCKLLRAWYSRSGDEFERRVGNNIVRDVENKWMLPFDCGRNSYSEIWKDISCGFDGNRWIGVKEK